MIRNGVDNIHLNWNVVKARQKFMIEEGTFSIQLSRHKL